MSQGLSLNLMLTFFLTPHRAIWATGEIPVEFRRSTKADAIPSFRRYTYPHVPTLAELAAPRARIRDYRKLAT